MDKQNRDVLLVAPYAILPGEEGFDCSYKELDKIVFIPVSDDYDRRKLTGQYARNFAEDTF